jgi:DNA-binding MarR family transcriptional regulator
MTYTLMSFEEYMSEVLKYNKVILGDTENRFLRYIMGNPKASYTIYSILKEKGRPMAYKNVHTRIKRLEDLKLIDKAPGKFARGAIRYKLTTQGLFYLVSQFIENKFSIFWDELWEYYPDNIVLRTLVLPYFEIETLRNAKFNLSSSMLTYLRNCYQITLDGCDYIRQFIVGGGKEVYSGGEVGYNNIQEIYISDLPGLSEKAAPDYTIKSAINNLKKELEWEAKEMAFSLITKPESSFGVFLARFNKVDIERTGKAGIEPGQLGKDKLFVKLLRQVKKDFDLRFETADKIARRLKY